MTLEGGEQVRYMTARRAAEELGISLPTLYSYVSRGLVRSEAAGEGRRSRRYRAEDVRRLKERKERRRDPDRVVEDALRWGAPVMESGITLISDGRLYYRGRDALELAENSSIEEVAALIWTGDFQKADEVFDPALDSLSGRLRETGRDVGHLEPLDLLQASLPVAAAEDFTAYDLRPRAVARTGARILRSMTGLLAGGIWSGSIAEVLKKGWAPDEPRAERLLDAALVLCADHELPVSTFAARCVASSGATPYAVVTAGLSAVQGVKHGGQIELVEKLLQEAEAADDARGVLAGRLRRGERVPGFGHSLYPEGDPRGAGLLRFVQEAFAGSAGLETSRAVAEAAYALIGGRPTVDFGLVTLARVLGLPSGSAVALFALGRTVGWIGHAIEQYEGDALIRPRARYVGEQPRGSG